jgi:hypothetical protein
MKTLALLLILVIVLSTPLLALRKVYQQGFGEYTGCEDTYMIEYRVESNYGGAIYIECQSEDGRDGGSNMKPLIRFNQLQLHGYAVSACTLQLYCYLSIGEYQQIRLHEMLRDWKEYQVNCLQYSNGLAWTDFACGCNDEDARSSYISSIVDSGGLGWKSFAIPPSVAQRWADAPGDTNNGLLIWASEEYTGNIKDRSFRSSDMFASSMRPKLIVHYDDPCGDLSAAPLIMDISDVPGDAGGFVEVRWQRSLYDQAGSDPLVRRYRIWRKQQQQILPIAELGAAYHQRPAHMRNASVSEEGPVWELVGAVRACGNCNYTYRVPTFCDSGGTGTWRISVCVSAHTGVPGDRFDSPVCSGYSVNNLALASPGPASLQIDEATGKRTASNCAELEVPSPNPSAGGCVFRFTVPRPGPVRISLYDVTGRLVTTLVNDHRQAGLHVISWDRRVDEGSEVSPGAYFVVMTTPAESRIQKLVVLK